MISASSILYRKGEAVGLYDHLGLTGKSGPEQGPTASRPSDGSDAGTTGADDPASPEQEDSSKPPQPRPRPGAVETESAVTRAWPETPPVTADTLAGLPGDTSPAAVQTYLLTGTVPDPDGDPQPVSPPNEDAWLYSIALPSAIRQGSLLATALAAAHAEKQDWVDTAEAAITATDFPVSTDKKLGDNAEAIQAAAALAEGNIAEEAEAAVTAQAVTGDEQPGEADAEMQQMQEDFFSTGDDGDGTTADD